MATVRTDKSPIEFQIWERIRLTVGEEGSEGIYSCRLSDIRKKKLTISRPQYERGKTLLANNRIVTVYCTRADAVYSFSARLKEIEPKSEDEMHLLELGTIKRVQRRRFVRIDKIAKLKYMVLTRPLNQPIDPSSDSMNETRSLNLSAGGMLILSDGTIKMDDLLLVAMEPSGMGSMPQLVLAACRHERTDENNKKVAGIEFILNEDIHIYLKKQELKMIPEEVAKFDDRLQNTLVTEIFAEQLVMRQKGIL